MTQPDDNRPSDPTRRFSRHVEAYVRYRPDYPQTLVPEVLQTVGLEADATVADIGSGTGIFSKQLLEQHCRVFAVEPNDPMREAAEVQLGTNPLFTSIAASAEATGLDDGSVDLVTAAQAFHWFNNAATRDEFRRILKPDGQVALIWNRRDTGQPLQQAYEGILTEFAPEYGKVNHMNIGLEEISTFLDPENIRQLRFDNNQRLDFSGLLGRLKSASYCPAEDSAEYIPMVTELLAMFDHFAIDGHIDFSYDTQVFLGPPGQ